MIEHKMRDVPDSVCQKCPQLWEDECRAFCVSHSEEERIHRTVPGGPRHLPCYGYKRRSEPKFPDEMDVKTLLLVAGAVILILVFVRCVG